MKIKTSELTGAALDWAVAKCEGVEYMAEAYEQEIPFFYREEATRYSTDWAQGGPIIEREGFGFEFNLEEEEFIAFYPTKQGSPEGIGKTHLIAAMRCYVASKLGDEVDVPEELTA
jgi:hypothetical protein